ncbi:MAG: hypothetical protein EOP18_12635 [Rhizobiaceae bacterium]|nr:MAG: hypothetical protein EOP18_12635 [Rhizobiaceae bacterium]
MSGLMINAVLFGLGAITVLSIPALAEQAKYLIPAVVVLSFVLVPFIAAPIARRMRLKNWGRRAWREGDAISG